MNEEGKLQNYWLYEQGIRLFSSYGSDVFPEMWTTTEPDTLYSNVMFLDMAASIGTTGKIRAGKRYRVFRN